MPVPQVRGSPTAVTVLSAAPDVARCEVLWKGRTGVGGLRSAACGEMMRLEIICRDAFGNSAVPSTQSSLKFGFGLVETPSNEGKHFACAVIAPLIATDCH